VAEAQFGGPLFYLFAMFFFVSRHSVKLA
jgi:hypothetical protein